MNHFSLSNVFVVAIALATALPFGAAFAPGMVELRWMIMFLALIHVPMTFYLLADPAIRSRVRERPIVMLAVPVLFFILCICR